MGYKGGAAREQLCRGGSVVIALKMEQCTNYGIRGKFIGA